MKKTLIICSHYPLPENIGSNMRTMNFVRFFKNYGDVDIAYSNVLPGGKVGNSIFSKEYCLEKESVDGFRNRLIRWVNIWSRPLPIGKLSDASEKLLLSLIESGRYDYIFVRYVINTWILSKISSRYRMRTIIDFDDILSGSLYESSIASANGSFRRFRLKVNRKVLVHYEKRCLNFGVSIFCSEKDRSKIVEDKNRGNAFVVPNVYHDGSFEHYDFGDGFRNGNILLFIGLLSYKPNIDGLRWFIESVFPEFKTSYTDTKLVVVGRFPAQEVIELCKSTEGVELFNDVPDVRDYYKRCRAFVVPLLSGGGTRIKILEAILANRPVLATPKGAEGLDLVEDRDILLFENASDFIFKYDTINKRVKYTSLVQNAKSIVLSKYSTAQFIEIMEKVINKL